MYKFTEPARVVLTIVCRYIIVTPHVFVQEFHKVHHIDPSFSRPPRMPFDWWIAASHPVSSCLLNNWERPSMIDVPVAAWLLLAKVAIGTTTILSLLLASLPRDNHPMVRSLYHHESVDKLMPSESLGK